MALILISVLPVVLIVYYIIKRDKYEPEPFKLIAKSFLYGMIAVAPIIIVELILQKMGGRNSNNLSAAFYNGFIVAALTEELFKYFAVMLAVWKNPEFNEKFDGIVYAVAVSLGFALVENIMYVFQNGFGVGVTRMFTAIPGHATFGIIMGYFLGLAKFSKNPGILKFLAILFPILAHGFYDFLLMSNEQLLVTIFFPFIIFLFFVSFKLMKTHSDNSRFKNGNNNNAGDVMIN